jgi:DNA polymerase-3 subunit beta
MSIYKSDSIQSEGRHQLIVPRKGVLELQRLLTNDESPVTLVFGKNHVRAITSEFTFTSKLVDGKFPDYERVLPKGGTKHVDAPREALRQALGRVAILSNEKYRGVRVILSENQMQVLANNPEQEEAEESVAVTYKGSGLEIGFNVSYLLDVTGVLTDEQVRLTLSDSNSSALIESASGDGSSVYVVMPMRL